MESQSSTNYIYVFANNMQQFNEYAQTRPDFQCIYIVDEHTLPGRTKGKVVELPRAGERWNAQPILESIDRFKQQYDLTDEGEVQQDLDYGIE